MVFDVKYDLRHKERLCAGGDRAEIYSIVVCKGFPYYTCDIRYAF
jgi:hypothetical protein